jgi:hypothetical protein
MPDAMRRRIYGAVSPETRDGWHGQVTCNAFRQEVHAGTK